MKTRARTFIAALTVMATMAGLTSCAHSQPEPGYPICTENEIVTYEPTDTTKTVITIGRYTIFNSEPLQKALSERIPEASFAFVDAPGTNDVRAYVKEQAERNDLPDMVFSGMRVGSGEYAYDLSAEGFTGRYNLSALEKLSVDGALRQLPINSSVKGIFYNKTLFEEHGWEIPTTLDEFYDLCDAITAEGIRPFVPCLKYSVQDVGLGLTSREVFGTSEKRARYDDVVNKEASCEGLLEPYYETLKQLYDRGIVVESDFTSSLTQNRQAMYAGEIAMIPSDLSMYSLYEQEKPGCEIDFIGFPTDTPNERWMQMSLGVNMMAFQKSMEDPQKKRILLDALDFLSSDEGQAVLFECFSGISNVKSYQQNIRPEFWDVKNCLDAGSIYFADRVGMTSDFETAFEWMRGNMTMQEIIEATDDFAPCNLYESMETPVIGKAAEDFTVLETSNLIADAMRDASGADVALLVNNYYYKGNSGKLYQGDISLADRFNLRSVTTDDVLTTYEISGADLKKLMEHPKIGGEEINATYALSGLKMEYAPWRAADQNVLSLTLPDGTEISDDAQYTVAAWAGSIDESYIGSILEAHADVGTNVDLMTAYLDRVGEVSPAKDGRITLIWD